MDSLIQDEEVRMIKAIAAYREGEALPISKAAQEWSVPYKKLQRRLKGARA